MSSKVCELTSNPEHNYCSECGTCHTCLDLENDSLAEKNKQLNIALTRANSIIERYKLDMQEVKAANKTLYAECKQYQGELVHADLRFLDLEQKYKRIKEVYTGLSDAVVNAYNEMVL